MSHVMSYVTRKSPSCTGDTAACILVVDRICSLSMVIASAVQIGLNCCRRQECPRHLLTMFLHRRHEVLSTTLLLARCIGTVSTPVCQHCQRRQEIWRYPGPVAPPDLQCHYCCHASVFTSIMGSVSSSRSRPQGMWDLQCQPAPGHGIICKRICCTRFHARGKAPINSQDVCIDGY